MINMSLEVISGMTVVKPFIPKVFANKNWQKKHWGWLIYKYDGWQTAHVNNNNNKKKKEEKKRKLNKENSILSVKANNVIISSKYYFPKWVTMFIESFPPHPLRAWKFIKCNLYYNRTTYQSSTNSSWVGREETQMWWITGIKSTVASSTLVTNRIFCPSMNFYYIFFVLSCGQSKFLASVSAL